MTTTPLPPFPRPSVFDPGRFGVAYSQAQMVDFATAARADLEAENKRLTTLMLTIKENAGNPEIVWNIARAALENTK